MHAIASGLRIVKSRYSRSWTGRITLLLAMVTLAPAPSPLRERLLHERPGRTAAVGAVPRTAIFLLMP
jgi:hypothetical protein